MPSKKDNINDVDDFESEQQPSKKKSEEIIDELWKKEEGLDSTTELDNDIDELYNFSEDSTLPFSGAKIQNASSFNDEEITENEPESEEFPQESRLFEEDSSEDGVFAEKELEEGDIEGSLSLEEEILLEEVPQKKSFVSEEVKKKNGKKKKEFESHSINIKEYISHHKLKIVLIVILIVVINVFLFISQVGITSKSLPEFKSDAIVVKSAQKVKIKFGFGETMEFQGGVIEFKPDSQTTIILTGDFTIHGSILTMISRNIKNASLKVKKGTIVLTEDSSSHSSVSRLFKIIDENLSIFSNIQTVKLNAQILNKTGQEMSVFSIKEFEMQNTVTHKTVRGIVGINNHNITLDYQYQKDAPPLKPNFKVVLMSHIFDFSINGIKQEFGTLNKESKISGNVELSVRNASQFSSILTKNPRISQYLIGFPQILLQSNFEYSSSGGALRLKEGKLNILNSLAKFELFTLESNLKYKATIDFQTVSFTEIANYVKSLPSIFNANKPIGSLQNVEHFNVFSLFGFKKNLEFEINAEKSSTKEQEILQNIHAQGSVSFNSILLNSLKANTNEKLFYSANGGFFNLLKPRSYGIFNFNIKGQAQNDSLFASTVEFLTRTEKLKPFESNEVEINFGLLLKSPSYIFHDVSVEIENYIKMDGGLQFLETTQENANPWAVFNANFENMNFKNTKANVFNFAQGSTLMQEIANNKSVVRKNSINFKNSLINETEIYNANVNFESRNGILQSKINVFTNNYNVAGKFYIDALKPMPQINSMVKIENLENVAVLNKDIASMFKNSHIFLPQLNGFLGSGHLNLKNVKILGEVIPSLVISGKMQNGVFEFENVEFASKGNVEGKIGGKVSFLFHKPQFNLNLSFVNAQIEKVQTILPISHKFDGTISGGGNFFFTGIAMQDIMTSLQMNGKFILKKITLPKMNLDFLAQNLIKTHGSKLYEFDKTYIEENFDNNTETLFNVLFKISGKDGKFVVEECNIKTAYTGGVCAGNLVLLPSQNFSFEAISKFAVPALDINKDLEDIMKLYISIKHEANSVNSECKITRELSQIYQYINYRRATFGI